jgi:hypothetical protein
VHGRAHAAEALGEEPRVPGVAAEEDVLDAAPHLARGPGLLHLPVVHLDVDAQVPLDPGDGVDDDVLAHALEPPRMGNRLTAAR